MLSVPLTAERASERASAAVDRLRGTYVPALFDRQADRVQVGGGPAETRDYFAVIEQWLPLVIAFVLALSFVVLTLAFRSIVVPLTAIAVAEAVVSGEPWTRQMLADRFDATRASWIARALQPLNPQDRPAQPVDDRAGHWGEQQHRGDLGDDGAGDT